MLCPKFCPNKPNLMPYIPRWPPSMRSRPGKRSILKRLVSSSSKTLLSSSGISRVLPPLRVAIMPAIGSMSSSNQLLALSQPLMGVILSIFLMKIARSSKRTTPTFSILIAYPASTALRVASAGYMASSSVYSDKTLDITRRLSGRPIDLITTRNY